MTDISEKDERRADLMTLKQRSADIKNRIERLERQLGSLRARWLEIEARIIEMENDEPK